MNADLNNGHYFLRGGTSAETAKYTYQEDALQQHQHTYSDKYVDDTSAGKRFMSGITNYFNMHMIVQSKTSGSVTEARTDNETRPKNMNVAFIMKCWHQSQN